ncbi:MAG: hypothetical protein Q7T77_12395 [Sulfuricurvum sp.]|nr:hypothetical protein [Sulfuricurvum sp.]
MASRVEVFREHFPSATIETILIHDDNERVVIQARISIGDTLISTGYSEEWRSEGWINATSALENAETSAVGRSLAAFGLSGSEYASANEVTNAVAQQQHKQTNQPRQEQAHSQQPQQQAQPPPAHVHNNIPQDYASLYKIGLSVVNQGNHLIVVGEDIFAKKDSIKAFGFRWDGVSKCWYKPTIDQQAA